MTLLHVHRLCGVPMLGSNVLLRDTLMYVIWSGFNFVRVVCSL